MQILIEANMEGLVSELMDHVSYVVLETARCLQSRTESQNVVKMSPMEVGHDDNLCNKFAEQLLCCTIDLPIPKVSAYALWHHGLRSNEPVAYPPIMPPVWGIPPEEGGYRNWLFHLAFIIDFIVGDQM